MARHKSNGRYVVQKKRIIETIKANKNAPTVAIHVEYVDGKHHVYYDRKGVCLPDIITEYTFKQTYQILLEIQYPFNNPEFTLIWEGNRHMKDLYALSQL